MSVPVGLFEFCDLPAKPNIMELLRNPAFGPAIRLLGCGEEALRFLGIEETQEDDD